MRVLILQAVRKCGIADNFLVHTLPYKLTRNPRLWVLMMFSALLLGCSPALDWRTTPVSGTALAALFPCKPDHFSRRLNLAGQSQLVTLTSCKAAGQTFAVAAVDVQQPLPVATALAALRESAEQNFGGAVQLLPSRIVRGADAAGRTQLVSAELVPNEGGPLRAQMLFFSQGSWVFQATVMGTTPTAEAVEFFFDNLKLAP
ncbi:MAG: hypothetical protein HEQ39_02925 [Rhizobacter sp.]